MTTVYLGVGSNIDRQANICAGLDALQNEFGLLQASSVYESAALGFDGPPFLNLVVALATEVELDPLLRYLRQLEYRSGRPRDATRFSSHTLDLDILSYGDRTGRCAGIELPRAEILENAYVLAPLAEIAPQTQHPQTGESYLALWQRLAGKMQAVTRVEFAWRGRALPFGL
jgi:2-amino-4-hydroxy-6-hydroxymethyldihydropteridine diphosphokinase